MENKIITVLDISNDHNQDIETLIVANILEKKCNKLTVMDLNPYSISYKLFPLKLCKEKDEIYSIKLFDRCNYMFPSAPLLDSSKMNNLVEILSTKNDAILINPTHIKFESNTSFYSMSNSIIVFADIKQNVSSKLLNFFLKHKIVNKNIYIFLYNYENNVQCDKTYLELTRRFKSDKVIINTIKEVPNFKTLTEISNIDPWLDIYKEINKIK